MGFKLCKSFFSIVKTGAQNDLNSTVRDMAQTSSIDYFTQLLPMTNLNWAREVFLEGYATSAGVGSESLMQATRRAFALYLDTLSNDESREVCMTVVGIFGQNHKCDRLALPTMNLLVFLVEAHILQISWCEELL